MERWILKGGRYREYAERFAVNPLLAKVLAARMQPDEVEDFLDKEKPISDPFLLPDMDAAVERILAHRQRGSRIRIVGDYDVDGITATAILYLGLRALGIEADCRIPERIGEGYGFSEQIAEEVLRDGVNLVITCDNGIREIERADFLKQHGVDLLITDHHEVEKDAEGRDVLPQAAAVVDPHRQDSRYPYPAICGAVTAYQLIRALRQRLDAGPADERLLGYAALGTICDVMPLTGENRRIVYKGLAALNREAGTGLRALMRRSGTKEISSYAAGYVLGPMLNAGGRLGSQNHYLDILTSEDVDVCGELAEELFQLNRERQQMTEEGIRAGLAQLGKSNPEHRVKVLYLPELHESIAGLVAGKIKELLYCPVFVVTRGETDLKGSGRSIPAYSMFEEMCKASELFRKFGGHPLAAGFSLAANPSQGEAAVQQMEQRLNALSRLREEDCRPEVRIDAAVRMQDIPLSVIQSLERLEPYGMGNPRPLFAQKDVKLKRARWLGQNHRALRLQLASEGKSSEALLFRTDALLAQLSAEQKQNLERGEYFATPLPLDICYQAEVDTYGGRDPKPKFIIQNLRAAQ